MITFPGPTQSLQVSVDGVTGPRANVSTRVESLIQEVKQVYVYFARGNTKVCPFFISQHCCQALNLLFCSLQVTDKPVAVGFGISRPEHVKQVRELSYHHII